jgi:hypothetical protein
MGKRIKLQKNGEKTTLAGTEAFPIDGSYYALISSIAAYIRTLTQTLTNKTLTTPTIGDFTNATHDHSNAAGGGLVAHSTIALFDHYANAGNTTTSETDLYSDTLAAGQFAANGDKVQADYCGVFVSSATATRQIKLKFAGTTIFDTGTLTLSLSSAWDMYVTLIRVSSTVVRYGVSLTTEGAALAAYTATGELTGLTLSGTNILKITGQAAGVGAATNDIVAQLGTVLFTKAA